MGWIKIEDTFLDHPKFIKAGPLCGYLNLCAIAWSNHHRRDGHIPRAQVPRLANFEGLAWQMWMGELVGGGEDVEPLAVAERLVEVGLWERDGRDYRVHDYLDWQASREQIESLIEQRRKAGRKGGTSNSSSNSSSKSSSNSLSKSLSNSLSKSLSNSSSKTQARSQAKAKQNASKKEDVRSKNLTALGLGVGNSAARDSKSRKGES